MNEKYIELAAKEFAKSGTDKFEKTYKVQGLERKFYKVTIVEVKPQNINESFSLEHRSETISALPSGSPCGCCGGSGRSR